MHELSIISKATASVERVAKENKLSKVTEITLEIGKIRAAVPELLEAAFDQLSPGTIFEGAKLNIIEVDVDLECKVCNRHIESEDSLLYGCPECGSHKIRLITGNELNIKSIKGE